MWTVPFDVSISEVSVATGFGVSVWLPGTTPRIGWERS
jgi:hypothetical protein